MTDNVALFLGSPNKVYRDLDDVDHTHSAQPNSIVDGWNKAAYKISIVAIHISSVGASQCLHVMYCLWACFLCVITDIHPHKLSLSIIMCVKNQYHI